LVISSWFWNAGDNANSSGKWLLTPFFSSIVIGALNGDVEVALLKNVPKSLLRPPAAASV